MAEIRKLEPLQDKASRLRLAYAIGCLILALAACLVGHDAP